jgi:serpin B
MPVNTQSAQWLAMALLLPALSFGIAADARVNYTAGVSEPVERQTQPIPSPQLPVMAAQTEFSFKLFSQLQEDQAAENLFISPLSISMALEMAANGAKGDTQTAMIQALQIEGIPLSQINLANQAVLEGFNASADAQIKLAIANSLWANQAIQLQPDFLKTTEAYYDAEVTNLDFSRPNAPDQINDWVRENTNGKIEQIIDQINPDNLLFLINAVYFKGEWSQQFDPKLTQDQPFTLSDGSQKQHPLMSQSGEYRYLETADLQAISLPYGKGDLSMIVLLPKEGTDLSDLYPQLTAANWQGWMQQMQSQTGSIQMPRFQMEYEADLIPTLSALGMGIAFDQQADFSGMVSEPALIDQVKHKTFVEVNEVGTEAAAVTSIGVSRMSAGKDTPFHMVVNRPFFCAIRDEETGMLLFMGSIVDPTL